MGSDLAITHLHSLLLRDWAEQDSLDTVKRGEAGSGDLTILITLDFALLHSATSEKSGEVITHAANNRGHDYLDTVCMSELDMLKEKLAYLKLWLGILVVTNISLIG
jgi:hypothetical protein